MEILCVEAIYPQYSGVIETFLALRYWFFEVLGSESVSMFYTKSQSRCLIVSIPDLATFLRSTSISWVYDPWARDYTSSVFSCSVIKV